MRGQAERKANCWGGLGGEQLEKEGTKNALTEKYSVFAWIDFPW
jgi:hypothetical protein